MKVLFICKANIGRSQMAEAFFNKLSKKNKASSAGLEVGQDDGRPIYNPETKTGEKVLKCMSEVGYDVAKNTRRQLTPEMVEKADKIIAMADDDELPDYLKNSPKVIRWKVLDAKGMSLEFHVKIRDQIRGLVERLVKFLK